MLFTQPFPCAVFEPVANGTTTSRSLNCQCGRVSNERHLRSFLAARAKVYLSWVCPGHDRRNCATSSLSSPHAGYWALLCKVWIHCSPGNGVLVDHVTASKSDVQLNLSFHRLDLRLHRPSIPSSLFVPQVSLSPHLKTGYRQCPDRLFSPSRAVKTTAYVTPRQSSPRSGPHITGHVYLGHSLSFLYVSLPFLCLRIPAPPFYLPFLFSIRHSTTPSTSTRVAYLYITLSPGPAKVIIEPIE